MNPTPAYSRRRCSALVSCEMFTNISASPRDPHGRGGTPDGEAEEEVGDDDGDDRAADGTPDGDADTRGAARGGVAVVAVDQDDRDREHDQLAEGPEHVDRRQELDEVVVVGPR